LIGKTLCALGAFAIATLGAGAILAPAPMTRGYGVPSDDSGALEYVRAVGARDIVLGAIIGAVLIRGDRRTLAATMLCCSLVGLADFLIVRNAQQDEAAPAIAIHTAGFAACSVVALLVLQEI
jgi:Domain of unknown function (DUF4267)